jgi:uncharacterized protein YbcI
MRWSACFIATAAADRRGARTTVDNDIVVRVLGATLTKGEQSLVQDGKAEVVLHSRRAFQDTMQADAITAVEELSGRTVVAFMSNNHIDPDLAVEVFILEPIASDGLDPAITDGASRSLQAAQRDGADGARMDQGREAEDPPRRGGLLAYPAERRRPDTV